MDTSLFSKTPSITVLDNRGLAIRNIAYHRHPDTPDKTEERITRHSYDPRGFLTKSADPRLFGKKLSNVTGITGLSGAVLCTAGADNGVQINLKDAAGRPFVTTTNIGTDKNGRHDMSNAVTRTIRYDMAGRPSYIEEQSGKNTSLIAERFFYAGNTAQEKAYNLAGQCIRHFDSAGLLQTDSIALTGIPLSVTRRLLKDADNPAIIPDWSQTEDAQLSSEPYTTVTTADATGAILTTTDATGHQQRISYDIAGRLSASWLTIKGEKEQAIIKSIRYSAAGQKLQEVHNNGVITTYSYEPETQRLIGIKTERPAGHKNGAKILQDLRYEYDPVGNILSITNDAEETRFWRNQKVVPKNTLIYDSLYQLVKAAGRETATTPQNTDLPYPVPADNMAYTNYTRIYTYDNAGNLTQIRHSSPATGNNYTTPITISESSNRGVLSSITQSPSEADTLFTPAGLQTILQPGQSLRWNSRNELQYVQNPGSAEDGESYRYDAGGHRILKINSKKSNTQYQRVIYLTGLELHTTSRNNTETESLQIITSGQAGRAQVRVLHWNTGCPAGITNNQIRYSYDNLSGSSNLELDSGGNIITLEEYYPYGGTAVLATRSKTEADYKTIRYSGKERDATGLYYYGHRYYQPWAGRWLSADPAGTADGLNLFRMVNNNPVSLTDTDGLAGEWLSKLFASDSAQLKKGNITPLRNRGLFVGNDSSETSLPFSIGRLDSVDTSPVVREYRSDLLQNGGNLYGAVDIFRGSQVTSFESGSGKIGTYWGRKTLSDDITGINVVNGMSGSVGIRINTHDIAEGKPVIITSGALSGCTMLYAMEGSYFYTVHTGQKPGDDEWKTGIEGISTTQQVFNILADKNLPVSGVHNNDLISTLHAFDSGTIAYMGKDGTRINQTAENVFAFDYNEAPNPNSSARVGYSYALLAKNAGKVHAKVLSEDVTINPATNKINVLNSMKTRLH
ncbi:cytotoxic necrotizing factor Rho-activating domain-containing protein [Morganella morganii]